MCSVVAQLVGVMFWWLRVLVWADNEIGAEGAAAMAPHVGKLMNLESLDLEGTHA